MYNISTYHSPCYNRLLCKQTSYQKEIGHRPKQACFSSHTHTTFKQTILRNSLSHSGGSKQLSCNINSFILKCNNNTVMILQGMKLIPTHSCHSGYYTHVKNWSGTSIGSYNGVEFPSNNSRQPHKTHNYKLAQQQVPKLN